MSANDSEMGSWTARVVRDRIEMVFSVANMTDRPWPIAETSMCYKHRGAVEFWPKNQLHRCDFSHTFERYDRVGLKNAANAGWQGHNNGTTAGWMAITQKDGEWLSGLFWDKSEWVCQNGPTVAAFMRAFQSGMTSHRVKPYKGKVSSPCLKTLPENSWLHTIKKRQVKPKSLL
ncbi:MAG TPA: hypothetical protein DIU35_18090 [Candidatus Latescibacteria bacterium]|nr:hypothetical protein [Gemmatimonadota bacterium]HCR19392.1 hypothetical protein [Candidatus Latescibacterota bacterium]|tara:strand:- start:1130 stop:1651 length:522 start_codon:yes stop_codon:yes gene_type:complete